MSDTSRGIIATSSGVSGRPIAAMCESWHNCINANSPSTAFAAQRLPPSHRAALSTASAAIQSGRRRASLPAPPIHCCRRSSSRNRAVAAAVASSRLAIRRRRVGPGRKAGMGASDGRSGTQRDMRAAARRDEAANARPSQTVAR
ncbi:hypothetical protein D9T17_03710 [Lysobacter enzymogenes]|uniref:Uncharacterized protein n=1 Tax=Lysobacter enzymogenes TaxID=69 RepID=A0A3N2RMG7_LYSEN|nr:hypothetical protein D9T17_03710 [Lysobacter enzymogenes]